MASGDGNVFVVRVLPCLTHPTHDKTLRAYRQYLLIIWRIRGCDEEPPQSVDDKAVPTTKSIDEARRVRPLLFFHFFKASKQANKQTNKRGLVFKHDAIVMLRILWTQSTRASALGKLGWEYFSALHDSPLAHSMRSFPRVRAMPARPSALHIPTAHLSC